MHMFRMPSRAISHCAAIPAYHDTMTTIRCFCLLIIFHNPIMYTPTHIQTEHGSHLLSKVGNHACMSANEQGTPSRKQFVYCTCTM